MKRQNESKIAASYLLPFYSLPIVFLLFLFQHQFNEQLLKLLVAIIDTELFETVHIEDLKPVNIKNSNHRAAVVIPFTLRYFNSTVYFANDP